MTAIGGLNVRMLLGKMCGMQYAGYYETLKIIIVMNLCQPYDVL